MPTPLKIGLQQARAQLPALVSQAAGGRRSVITRHGQACAAIVPMADLMRRPPGGALLTLRGSGAGLWGAQPAATVAALRDEWD